MPTARRTPEEASTVVVQKSAFVLLRPITWISQAANGGACLVGGREMRALSGGDSASVIRLK